VSGVAPLLARLAAGTFFGAALYINLVQHPAALAVGTDFAARFFGPMYHRAAVMQATLAIVGTLAGLLAWRRDGGARWLAGALLLFAVVPVTLIWILPVNAELLAAASEAANPETADRLARWARLHAVRTALGGASFLAFLLAAGGPRGIARG
jgi:uncharacterized membrane protein